MLLLAGTCMDVTIRLSLVHMECMSRAVHCCILVGEGRVNTHCSSDVVQIHQKGLHSVLDIGKAHGRKSER
eukprot:m.914836 g.914836  ORF g.914836 m.914836 type:complete len:71 (-) comp23731_c0_seq1:11-223(-)